MKGKDLLELTNDLITESQKNEPQIDNSVKYGMENTENSFRNIRNVNYGMENTEFLAVATLTPINLCIDGLNQKSKIENRKSFVDQEYFHFIEEDDYLWDEEAYENLIETLRRTRLETAVENLVMNPFRTIAHNVVRRYYERRTEVELLIENRDFPRFFAQSH